MDITYGIIGFIFQNFNTTKDRGTHKRIIVLEYCWYRLILLAAWNAEIN